MKPSAPQVQRAPDPAPPPAHRLGVGEVDNGCGSAEVRDKRVRAPVRVRSHIALGQRFAVLAWVVGTGRVQPDEGTEVQQRVDMAGPELGDVVGEHRLGQFLPAFDPVGIQMQAVVVDVAQVRNDLLLVG